MNLGSSSVPDLSVIAERLDLREYQRDAARVALEHRDDAVRVHVLEIPTGGGKNRTGIALAVSLRRAGKSVVWVAKNWSLLDQTHNELVSSLPEYAGELRRIGGDDTILRHLSDGPGGRIFFTTLATWNARRDALPKCAGPSSELAVILDEAHWGLHSKMGRRLRDRHRDRAVVYGLTATPVTGPGVHVIYSKPYEELAGTVLARRRIREVATGTEWEPELLNEDFAPASLGELGHRRQRNRTIVDELDRGRREGHYHRTLIFACDLAHAERLNRLISQRGIPSRVVHSQLGRRDRDDAIEGFRHGRVGVLVNVAMLTEGIDIPEIDSVFLARPTCSSILLTQMVGRGARRAPGKESFWVVEFTDNLRRLVGQVVRARDVINDDPAQRRSPRSAYRPAVRHAESEHPPRFEDLPIPGYGTLPIAVGQTFGVEIELTAPSGASLRGPGMGADGRDHHRSAARNGRRGRAPEPDGLEGG